jgi:DnaJ-class molecular chaperone
MHVTSFTPEPSLKGASLPTSTTMASNLYEILEISATATPEQSMYTFLHCNMIFIPFPVRKAYKKKALQTHPDRLPLGATPEDKAASEEMFRKVKTTCMMNLIDHVQSYRSTTHMRF